MCVGRAAGQLARRAAGSCSGRTSTRPAPGYSFAYASVPLAMAQLMFALRWKGDRQVLAVFLVMWITASATKYSGWARCVAPRAQRNSARELTGLWPWAFSRTTERPTPRGSFDRLSAQNAAWFAPTAPGFARCASTHVLQQAPPGIYARAAPRIYGLTALHQPPCFQRLVSSAPPTRAALHHHPAIDGRAAADQPCLARTPTTRP